MFGVSKVYRIIPSDSEFILSFDLSRNRFPEEISGRQNLYGGAQYHRTLRSFYHRIRTVQIPFSTSEEILLLMGGTSRGAMHSSGDILLSVAILASRQMETLADLLLDELGLVAPWLKRIFKYEYRYCLYN